MNKYAWDVKYSVGHEKIDAQHRKIFGILREIQLAFYENIDSKLVLAIIKDLQLFVIEHFSLEEGEMLPYKDKLPTYAEHIQQHLLLVYSVNVLMEHFQQDGAKMAEELYEVLQMWLKAHIQDMDMKTFKIINTIKAQ